jgi:hypothetical protein
LYAARWSATSALHVDGLDGTRLRGSMGESLLLASRPGDQHDGDIVIAQVKRLRRNDDTLTVASHRLTSTLNSNFSPSPPAKSSISANSRMAAFGLATAFGHGLVLTVANVVGTQAVSKPGSMSRGGFLQDVNTARRAETDDVG